MTTTKNNPSSAADREIVLTRVVNAPRELVWDAFTDPKKIVKWWGPKGFTDTVKEMDVRAGGKMHHTMHGPDGTDYPNMNIFIEVVKYEKIVYGPDPAMGDQGGHCPATWTFEDAGAGKTRVTGRLQFPSREVRDQIVKDNNAIVGGNQTLDRLEGFMAGKTYKEDFVYGRTFDAPIALVWKCFTDPKHLDWWGTGMKTHIQSFELKPGGVNHYYMQTPDGGKMWGRQVFREIVPQEKLVYVNSFSDEKAGLTRHPMSQTWPLEMLTVITFKSEGPKKTRLVIRWTPINVADEIEWKTFDDGRGSMRGGWGGVLDKLAEYLKTVKA